MEHFTIKHTNEGKIFSEKFDNKHASFDLKYFKTRNLVPLSVDVFCRWVAEFGNLDNEDFQLFHRKASHLI